MALIISADKQYEELVRKIIQFGSKGQNRTGIPTRKLFGEQFRFDLQKQFPIITKKKMFFESAKKELFWIYVDQSNDVNLLRDKYGVTVWDEWQQADGTIGHAYGYIVRKHKQIDKLIEGLKNDPQGRRHIISLWDIEELPNMALQPCAFQTIWDVDPETNRLNMQLVQRSGDVGLGVPFNMTQYAILQHMVAHIVGLDVGQFWYTITNAHLYENHVKPISQIFERQTPICHPHIEIVRDVKDWYDFKPEDIVLHDYVFQPHIPLDVAV